VSERPWENESDGWKGGPPPDWETEGEDWRAYQIPPEVEEEWPESMAGPEYWAWLKWLKYGPPEPTDDPEKDQGGGAR
jgi:hypothetical protein